MAQKEQPTTAETVATVRNADGIHCRPSVLIVKAAEGYDGAITVASDLNETNLRSVMSLMTLGLREGDCVTIRVNGPDAADMCRRLADLFETHFDFPPRPAHTASDD